MVKDEVGGSSLENQERQEMQIIVKEHSRLHFWRKWVSQFFFGI